MRSAAILSIALTMVTPAMAESSRRLRPLVGVQWTDADPAAEADRRISGLSADASASAFLELASDLQDAGESMIARFVLERAFARFDAVETDRAYVASLLAVGLPEKAEATLEVAFRRHPEDGQLLESAAVAAAELGHHESAVSRLRKSWMAGRDPQAWLGNGALSRFRLLEGYRDLIQAPGVVASLRSLDMAAQADRLALLSRVAQRSDAAAIAGFLSSQEETSVLLAGLTTLETLRATEAISSLLRAPAAKIQRQALHSLRQLRDPAVLDGVESYRAQAGDAGNRDLAAVLIAELEALALPAAQAIARLEHVDTANRFRNLVDADLAVLYRSIGQLQAAADAEARSIALSGAAPIEPDGGLTAYWECMERTDIKEMLELLHQHRTIGRIDARIYGLPMNDFDDQKNLTIAERLFLRQWAAQRGLDWATEGPMQYPREIRHTLRRIAGAPGSGIDCSGHLIADGSPSKTLLDDGGEIRLESDSTVDNEANIVVDPWDPRYVIATSNDYDGATGNDLYRSSDWGNTWTSGDVPVAGNCCDPVTQYTRTNVGGTPTDVAYHSTLTNPAYVTYSTNHGVSWTGCSGVVSANSTDRQDHVIDSNSASPCYNKIYVGYQIIGGSQRISTSTGATFPYCQSWSVYDTTLNNTIGSAMVVSTNGAAHNIFIRHGTGQVYHSRSFDCGANWTTSAITTTNNSGLFEWGIPSTCSRKVYRYPNGDSDRAPSSAFFNNIYFAYGDLSSNCTAPDCAGNTTCNNDIFFVTGTPNNRTNPTSWTWNKVNLTSTFSDAYTDEFYQGLSVDPADGSIYLTYYRSGSGAGGNIAPRRDQVHYVATRSTDGGATWETPFQITDQSTNESCCGADTAMQWGDYTWSDVAQGVMYPIWTDRRDGADEEIWSAKVCTQPAHWTERAPTFTAPPTTVTPSGSKNFDVAWTLPDIYWGDGGESPASRKFQLWVDGVLAQDNIAATLTSTTYTNAAYDCSTSHAFQIRAINQCGVSKSYATGNATATGCCAGNPSAVNVLPAGPLTLCQGTGQLLTASLTGGTAPFVYQWTRDGLDIGSANSTTYTANDTGSHVYNCKVTGSGCAQPAADGTPTSITWQTAPTFAGLTSVTNPQAATCTLNLAWSAATTVCAGGITYNVYRSTTSGFVPGAGNLLVSGVSGLSYSDSSGLLNGTTYYYVVRAVNSGFEDANTVQQSGAPSGPGGGTTNYASTDVPKSIPDNNASGATSTLTVTGTGAIVDVVVNVNIPHTYIGDLDVTLTSPLGTVVKLHDNSGGSADNIVTTYDTLTAVAVGSMNDFNGQNPAGVWSLKAVDSANIDTGTIAAWSLDITRVGICGSVPAEAGATPATRLGWTNTTTLDWGDNTDPITGYRLYRGVPADLAGLLTSTVDACLRVQTATSTATATETPSAGSFYWYLALAYNGSGEGSAGVGTAGPRVLNSSGNCP